MKAAGAAVRHTSIHSFYQEGIIVNEHLTEPAALSPKLLEEYRQKLLLEEYSPATIQKYSRDLQAFYHFLPEAKQVSKEQVIRFKQDLERRYAVASANSMLVAVNRFLKSLGLDGCCVKLLRVQRRAFCEQARELSKQEYYRLLNAARNKGDERLLLLMQTICSTGIRVSELKFISVEALKKGCAQVSCKGKVRTIFLPRQLCSTLEGYCRTRGIHSGSVFITRSGQPMDRSNIWTAMKQLCRLAGVSGGKVFPHNLRHLFARTFYQLKKDVVHLADLLGHASVETTRIYTASSGSDHNQVLSQMRLYL